MMSVLLRLSSLFERAIDDCSDGVERLLLSDLPDVMQLLRRHGRMRTGPVARGVELRESDHDRRRCGIKDLAVASRHVEDKGLEGLHEQACRDLSLDRDFFIGLGCHSTFLSVPLLALHDPETRSGLASANPAGPGLFCLACGPP